MLMMTSRPVSGSVRRAAVNDSSGAGQSRRMPRILPVMRSTSNAMDCPESRPIPVTPSGPDSVMPDSLSDQSGLAGRTNAKDSASVPVCNLGHTE